MAETLVGEISELGPGTVRGAGSYAVLNVDGKRFAVSRRCRHLRADLANGTVDANGCLVCPWHHAAYDPATGRMVRGPQAGFEKIPGLGSAFKALTKIAPLGHADVIERDGKVYIRS